MTNDISTLNGALTELGETMASNITSKGVTASASDGLTTLADKILNIAEDDIITITANRPYITSTEKTDLIVHLTDGLGQPLSNKSVTVTDGTNTYNGTTNTDGNFTIYNVSISADTTFTATYGTISATCKVEYYRFVDYAVKNNHNSNYLNQAGTSKITITGADEYKEFKTISTSGGNIYIGSSTAYTNFDVGNTWTIIWDKLHINGYNVAFQCYNGSTTVGINSTALLLHNSDFQELKFVCDGSSIKAYVDGVYKTQTSYTSTGHGYLRINLNNNNGASQVTFRAKNIRIK